MPEQNAVLSWIPLPGGDLMGLLHGPSLKTLFRHRDPETSTLPQRFHHSFKIFPTPFSPVA
jgi:hypothetical protein